MERAGISVTQNGRPKGVQPKIKLCKLRNVVYWQGGVRAEEPTAKGYVY